MSGDNLNVLRDAPAGSEGVPAREGFTRSVEETGRREGRSGLATGRTRLYRYDRTAGLANAVLRVEFDKTDRMPVEMASDRLEQLHEAHGVNRSMEGVLYDYDHALFICYAINGSSQVGPMGRVKFKFSTRDAMVHDFEYETVAKVLGIDFRRFFRTFANDVVDSCRDLYLKCDFSDPIQVEMRDQMIQLADHRGISRFPWLVADCADAATNVSPTEMSAVMQSKQLVIGASTNAVDRRNNVLPIRSMDNFDSSTGRPVSNANDIHAASQSPGAAPYYYN